MKPIDIRDVLPRAIFEVFHQERLIARFSSREKAQRFISRVPGATIKDPDLRSEMNRDQIATAEYLANRTGDGRDMYGLFRR